MNGPAGRTTDLIFVGHRCCDHSPSSGYDQLCALFPEAGWLSGPALEAGRVEWHREPAAVSAAPPLFHVFYGDCSGRALPAILRQRYPGARIISSAHKPVSRLRDDPPALQALGESDAVLAVSERQARELAALGLSGAVYAVPHGVWTHVFRPVSASARPRSDVLVVGSFLRDWDGAVRVIAELARHGVRSIAVGAGARDHLRGAGPDVLPRVPEDELAALYDRSAAVFLPLLDATASNALLEAMAAGCPVVCPRFPSLVDEYLGDDSDAFEIGRYDLAAALLLRYARVPADRDARSRLLTARAAAFDWSGLRPRYEAVYREVVASAELTYGLS